jgi:hypothetical protein
VRSFGSDQSASLKKYLKSDFVSGQVVVGVRPTLPFEDISLLFGIDLAGDKVIMVPIMSEEPS